MIQPSNPNEAIHSHPQWQLHWHGVDEGWSWKDRSHQPMQKDATARTTWWRSMAAYPFWDLRYDVAAFTLLTLHSRVKHLPYHTHIYIYIHIHIQDVPGCCIEYVVYLSIDSYRLYTISTVHKFPRYLTTHLWFWWTRLSHLGCWKTSSKWMQIFIFASLLWFCRLLLREKTHLPCNWRGPHLLVLPHLQHFFQEKTRSFPQPPCSGHFCLPEQHTN